MTPESAAFLTKARRVLSEADIMFAAQLFDAAGRSAYLAAFHAAQALLFQVTHRVFKTHKGVQTEFLHLIKDDTTWNEELRPFLSRSYRLKSIADYETGDVGRSPEEIAAAIETAKRFVGKIETIVSDAPVL